MIWTSKNGTPLPGEKQIPTLHTVLEAELHDHAVICLTSADLLPEHYDPIPVYRADVMWLDLAGVWMVTDAPLTECRFPTLAEAIAFVVHRCDREIEHYRRTGRPAGMSVDHSTELWRRLVQQADARGSAMEEELESFFRGEQ